MPKELLVPPDEAIQAKVIELSSWQSTILTSR